MSREIETLHRKLVAELPNLALHELGTEDFETIYVPLRNALSNLKLWKQCEEFLLERYKGQLSATEGAEQIVAVCCQLFKWVSTNTLTDGSFPLADAQQSRAVVSSASKAGRLNADAGMQWIPSPPQISRPQREAMARNMVIALLLAAGVRSDDRQRALDILSQHFLE